MENILPIHLQEVIFGSSDSRVSKQLTKLEKAGKIRKTAPRIYSSNLIEPIELIIRRNLFQILGRLYPGAILSHRSAFEYAPTETGHIFITYTYTKKIFLPSITISFIKGKGPIEGDNTLSGELYVSQKPRALLENLQTSRRPGPSSKCLPLPEIEEKLEQIIRVNGEDELNKVRDKAKEISKELNMQNEFERLNKMIAALLTTHGSKIMAATSTQFADHLRQLADRRLNQAISQLSPSLHPALSGTSSLLRLRLPRIACFTPSTMQSENRTPIALLFLVIPANVTGYFQYCLCHYEACWRSFFSWSFVVRVI